MARRSFKETVFGAEENSAAKLDPGKLSRFQKIAARMYHTPQLPAVEVGVPALAKVGRQFSEVISNQLRMFYFVSVLRIDMV